MKGYIEKAQLLGFSVEIKDNKICVFAATGKNTTRWWYLKTLQEFISFIDGASHMLWMKNKELVAAFAANDPKEKKEEEQKQEQKAPRPVEVK